MWRAIIRSGAVAVAVIGLVTMAFSAPASAVVPTSTTGTFTFGGDDVYEFGGDDPNPCAATNIDVAFDGDGTSGTWGISGTIKIPYTFFSEKLQIEFTFLASTGGTYALGAPGAYDLTGRLDVDIVIQHLDKEGDCAKSAVCTLRSRLIVDSAQSSHAGTLPSPGVGDATDMVATTEQTGGIRPFVVSGSCPVTIHSLYAGQSLDSLLTLGW